MKGLVLAGGESRRFGSDKANAIWDGTGQTFVQRAYGILEKTTVQVWVSCRRSQQITFTDHLLFDTEESPQGPRAGFMSAYKSDPTTAWFVMACDMTGVDLECIEYLKAAWHRNPEASAVLFNIAHPQKKNLLQPLLGIWTPKALQCFATSPDKGPQDIARQQQALGIPCPNPLWLKNQNSPALG